MVQLWTGDAAPPVDALAEAASAEGHRFVERTLTEWALGHNRFDGTGEGLFLASADGMVIGMAGVNVDPYVIDPSVARLRHLYVIPTHRRRGVASALVDRCIDLARGSFAVLRLRTYDPEAAAFYSMLGFEATSEADATHAMVLATPA